MNRVFLSFFLIFCTLSFTSSVKAQQTIMVIPFTKDGEDIRTILDNSTNTRIAIAKVKEGFSSKGYITIDFVGKLKAARDNEVFNSDNQTDIKSKIIAMSGCDIFVVVEVGELTDNSGSSVNVILSAYETSTGNSLASKVGVSGKFFTNDYGKLTSKAVETCINEFVETMNNKISELSSKGYAVLVDFSLGQNSQYTMRTEISKYKMALSDVLEDWFSKNTINGDYHIQGTTELKMIFDNVRVPLKDTEGKNYNTNRYALDITRFLTSIQLKSTKDIKGNTIYITIN